VTLSLKTRISIVYQDSSIFPIYLFRENIVFALKCAGENPANSKI